MSIFVTKVPKIDPIFGWECKQINTFCNMKFVRNFLRILVPVNILLFADFNNLKAKLEYCIHIFYCSESGRFLGGSHVQSRFCPVN